MRKTQVWWTIHFFTMLFLLSGLSEDLGHVQKKKKKNLNILVLIKLLKYSYSSKTFLTRIRNVLYIPLYFLCIISVHLDILMSPWFFFLPQLLILMPKVIMRAMWWSKLYFPVLYEADGITLFSHYAEHENKAKCLKSILTTFASYQLYPVISSELLCDNDSLNSFLVLLP